jgi:hypothetical protein
MNKKEFTPLTVLQTKELVESILPEKYIREIGLFILAEGIKKTNSYRRDNWAVTQVYPNTLWFQVGHYATLIFEKKGLWLALDKELINSSPNKGLTFLSANKFGWKPDGIQFKDKHKPGIPFSICGYYLPKSQESHREIWPYMSKLFYEFIYKANDIGQVMTSTTKKLHNIGILNYLRKELGEDIPNPVYR